MSWNAVLPYKGKSASPGEIARGLAVRYQVEGSVRHTGDRVRVIAQLVNTDGRVLWSCPFRRGARGPLCPAGQDHHSDRRGLGDPRDPVRAAAGAAKPTESLEAYDYVLRARPALQRPARAINVEARALLRRAIQLDPNYAAAYAALAETYYHRRIDGLGAIAGGIPEPRRGNGQQGAQSQRLRGARPHRPRPHSYLLPSLRAGEGRDRPCDRDQSQRCPWPRRPRQYPDVARGRRMRRSRPWSWRSGSIPSSIRSIALPSVSPTI